MSRLVYIGALLFAGVGTAAIVLACGSYSKNRTGCPQPPLRNSAAVKRTLPLGSREAGQSLHTIALPPTCGMSGPAVHVPVPVGVDGGEYSAVLPWPPLLAAPKKIVLPLYSSIAGPISLIAESTSVTGGVPSTFQEFVAMTYFSPLKGALHWTVTTVPSGWRIHVSSLERTAMLPPEDHELDVGSKIADAVDESAPTSTLPSGSTQQAASPTSGSIDGSGIAVHVSLNGS